MVEARYEASGHEVVLRHKDEPTDTKYGNHSAWFGDGSTSVYLKSAYDNQSEFPEWLQDRMSAELVDASFEELKALLAFLADNDMLVCRCGRLFHMENAVGTGFAGVKCGVCASDDAYCPDSPDGEHEDNCTNPRQKHNARVATKYKCEHCGRTRKTTPTG